MYHILTKNKKFMKKNIQLLFTAILALSISLTSCKKDSATTDINSNLATHGDDQSRVSNETDAIANDADAATENYAAFSGRPGPVDNAIFSLPCDADVVLDSTATDRRITITYNGTNCQGTRVRTGVVVLTMPLGTHWRDQGAVLTESIQNLHITRLSDNKSITINGTRTITNTSGGRLIDLPIAGAGATRVHDVASSGINVTFDDGTTRAWQVSKRRTFTYDNGIVCTITGTHSDGTYDNIAEWGTNRFGNSFSTSISTPVVIRQDCAFRIVSGELTTHGLVATIVTTFGLDANGNSTSCPGTGYYYLKIVFTGTNGVVRTVIRPY